MKKSTINFLITSVLWVIVVTINSCSEQGMESTTTQTSTDIPVAEDNSNYQITNYFSKTTGAPIDNEKANRWISNYTQVNGRGFEYHIKVEALKAILLHKNCNGISFRYGLDANNLLHIIPVGVDNTGIEMKANGVPTENGDVSWERAKEFTATYQGMVRSHFFGANTFERLFRNVDCKIVRVTAAIDDRNQPQLLLSDPTAPGEYEDESSPCPPHCEGSI